MQAKRKPADAREKDLLLALKRLEHSRANNDKKKLTIAAVAREAGVSAALIHNHYPIVAAAIRKAQGRSSRAQFDSKNNDLRIERDKARALRLEIKELRDKVSRLASINEVLNEENRNLKAKENNANVIPIR